MTENEQEQFNGMRVTDRLIRLAETAQVELFATPIGDTFANVPKDEPIAHRENLRIKSKAFRDWLRALYLDKFDVGIGGTELAEVVETLDAKASVRGKKKEAYVRLAKHDGKLYLDLANDFWQVVEIDEFGWRVINNSPVAFWRPNGTESLPEPKHEHKGIEPLKKYIGGEGDDFVLMVAWLIGTYMYGGPYAHLGLTGSAGSGKTSRATYLTRLIDPRTPITRQRPKSLEDVGIAAKNSHVIVYDNLSGLLRWLSDALSGLATGLGITTREFYTNDQEARFRARNPIIFTGIDEVGTKEDLLDRTLLIHPNRIRKFRKEEELEAEFVEDQPALLGAVLDAVSTALLNKGTVDETDLARMADFDAWVRAAEPALGWPTGTFKGVYAYNRTESDRLVVEASPVAQAIIKLTQITEGNELEVTMNDLLSKLNMVRKDVVEHERLGADPAWPRSANKLSSAINRIAHSLEVAEGITVTRLGHSNQGTKVGVYWTPKTQDIVETAKKEESKPPTSVDDEIDPFADPDEDYYYGSDDSEDNENLPSPIEANA